LILDVDFMSPLLRQSPWKKWPERAYKKELNTIGKQGELIFRIRSVPSTTFLPDGSDEIFTNFRRREKNLVKK
jgi:hypothetical protein